MDWVEQRIKERAERSSRASIIAKSVSDIWTNLRAATVDSVQAYSPEAIRKGQTVRTNGQEYATIVVRRESSQAIPTEAGAVLTATLDRNKPEISIAYEGDLRGRAFRFAFDIHDGSASLFHEGNAVSTERAAELMISPLLFPDLI